MAVNDFIINTITANFDSLDNNLSDAEAICNAMASLVELGSPLSAIGEEGEQLSKAHPGNIATLLRHAAVLLNVASEEAYNLRLHALSFGSKTVQS